jgi:phosphoribosylaminoimidazole carboxylase (NCAIR synthetase)
MASAGPVGILGGGQLGLMLALAAIPLGIKTVVLDPDEGCPAAQAATEVIKGAFTDLAAIRELAKKCAVLTVEIEHVNASALSLLESEGVIVNPSSVAIALIQDKLHQKRHMRESGIPCADFIPVDSASDVQKCADVCKKHVPTSMCSLNLYVSQRRFLDIPSCSSLGD